MPHLRSLKAVEGVGDIVGISQMRSLGKDVLSRLLRKRRRKVGGLGKVSRAMVISRGKTSRADAVMTQSFLQCVHVPC